MKKLLFMCCITMPSLISTGAVGFMRKVGLMPEVGSSSDVQDYSIHSQMSRDRRQEFAKKRSSRHYSVFDVIQRGGVYLLNGTTINLARCNLVSLRGLDDLPATVILNLADNPLIALDKQQFKLINMRNLRVLSLRNTLLDELTPEQCAGLEHLEELDISYNYIYPMPDPQALGLKNLKKFIYEPQLTYEEAKKLGF